MGSILRRRYSDSGRTRSARNVPKPCFHVQDHPSTQEQSVLSSRTQANDCGPGRPSTATEFATVLLSADLTTVVEAWDRLPEAIRAGIVAMVKAAAGDVSRR